MARQKLGEKKLARYRRETGLPVVYGLVRGNTDHRVDLLLEDGSIVCRYKDGSLEKSPLRWKPNGKEE